MITSVTSDVVAYLRKTPLVGPVAVLVAMLVAQQLSRRARRRGVPLPPGPPGWPIIGNVLDLPTREEWVTYGALKERYGDVAYLNAAGQPIVLVGSQRSAIELFERRGSVHSSRPHSNILGLCGAGALFAIMPYGEAWRARRRAFHAANLAEQVVEYRKYELESVHVFLKSVLQVPGDVFNLSRYMIGSVIMRTTYGIKIQKQNDKYIEAAEQMSRYLDDVITPGRFWVNFFPFLRFVPEWMPGAGFQRFASKVRTAFDKLLHEPWNNRSLTEKSMASRMLEVSCKLDDKEQIAREAAGQSYMAGVDTTNAVLRHFMAAMLLHPEVQAKAQAELDTVVGNDRLPDHSDRTNLPYVNAVFMETLRWKVILPTGLPRCSTADDVFNGMFIPKGTILLPNMWGIAHDPEIYADPDEFTPERFLRTDAHGQLELDPDVFDPITLLFGYGRRRCPGIHIAQDTLFAAMVSILATLNFTPACGEHGEPEMPTLEYTSGLLCEVRPFKCSIKPRSARAMALVVDAAEEAERAT